MEEWMNRGVDCGWMDRGVVGGRWFGGWVDEWMVGWIDGRWIKDG